MLQNCQTYSVEVIGHGQTKIKFTLGTIVLSQKSSTWHLKKKN